MVRLLLPLVAFAVAVYCDEVQELGMARIVASKFMLSQYAVENKDFIVEYKLYNVGDKASFRI